MRLVLGTAQFGFPYGITNTNVDRVSDDQVLKIFDYAYLKGIKTLDTAFAYGESQVVIGNAIARQPNHQFKIITKCPPIRQNKILPNHIINLENSFEKSRVDLKVKNIYGLMVHDSLDLTADSSELVFEKLIQFKEKKQVKKIGCSFYSPEDLYSVLEKFDLDMVQIPLNIFDQRFIKEGVLPYLREKKIEVYVRSVFLQGLLLADFKKLESINMLHVKPYIDCLDAICKENNINRLSLIVSFMKQHQECQFVMGFNSFQELHEVVDHIEKDACRNEIDFSFLAVENPNITNPTLWKNRK